MTLRLENLLSLDFATMIADPADTVSQLEKFTGANGIDSAVFNRRVNDLGNSHWVPPAELSEEETAAINLYLSAA
ncbi:MAG: hypothetical protein HC845_04055 [Akkermansiaceae bacterium]|nr:hypothetical protein [Akkermansiaceae bacterium]